MFWPIILISTVIILIAVFLLGFRVFLFKDGKFPNTHIGGNKALQEKGITCATSQGQDTKESNKERNVLNRIKEIEEK